ncbi:MFS transporter, partial [Rubrivivax gelatinosus]|uniref:MFS transporter n=1 Tax=Rubrivivax gelatinosus TaxID=28068 RepID=UPI0018722FF3
MHEDGMDGERRRHELSAAEVAAALAVGSVALLVLGLMPILLGELLSARRLSLEGLGIVAMAEIVSLGLGVLLGDLLLPLTRLRLVTVVAAAVAGGLDLGTLQASGDAGFALLRAGAGLAEGALVWATTAVIVRCPNPDRVAGIFFVMQTAAQALLGFALARSVIPAHGWQGAYVVLAALVVVPMFAAAALPRALAPLASLWSYVEPLGQQAGFSGPQVQTLIAAALVVQMAGGLSGSALVRHLAPAPTLLAASALLGLVALG